MTTLWLAIALLTAAALAPPLWMLLRRRPPSQLTRQALLLAQLKQQLAEVDREVERGMIAVAEADGLRLEIKRRLLALATEINAGDGAPAAASGPRRPALAIGVAALVTVGAVAIYLAVGAPGVPDQPLAARRGHEALARAGSDDTDLRQFREALAALERRLGDQPDDIRGWTLLGAAYRAEQRYAEAARAFGEAYRRSGENPALAADLAETMTASAGGRLSAEALALFRQALAFDPRDPRARFFLALGEAQTGDLASALQGWVDLALLTPPDAPYLPALREHIARAAAVLGVDAASIEPSAEARALAAPSP